MTDVTDAGLKAEKQVADIEMVLAENPQIIVSIPTDSVATAVAYKEASQRGVKLVFMENVPIGLEAEKITSVLYQRTTTGTALRRGSLTGKISERQWSDRTSLLCG